MSVLAPVLLGVRAGQRSHRRAGARGTPAAAAGRRWHRRSCVSGSTGWPPPRSNRARRRSALAEAERGLELLGEMSNDELRWRLAAVGAVAPRSRGQADKARAMRASARKALVRLRSDWPDGVDNYQKRPDLAELIGRGSVRPEPSEEVDHAFQTNRQSGCRNGSMKITLVSGEWVASGQAWVPLDGHERGRVRRCRRVRDQVGSQARAAGLRHGGRRFVQRPQNGQVQDRSVHVEDQGHAKGDPQEDGGQGPGAWAGRQGLHHRREGEGPRHQLDVRVRKPRRPFRDRHLSVAAPASEAAAADAPEEVALPRPGGLAAEPPGTLRLRVTGGDVSARGAPARRRGRTPG